MSDLARAGETRRWLAGVLGGALGVALLATFASSGFGSGPRVAWIAYVRHDDVYVVDPATGETRRFTQGRSVRSSAGIAGDVSISPNGAEIAYTLPVSGRGRFDYASTIAVQPTSGGSARNVTPWNSVGYDGQVIPEPRHIDPHWLDSTHLDYTDDLQSNGQSYGIPMTIDVANGRHGEARVPSSVERQVLEPFVAAGRYTAYPVLQPRAYDCASTLDLARAVGSKQVRMSYTPLEDEEPLDVDAAGNVLALRFWVVSGAHNGLCLLNGTGSLTYELVVFGGDGSTRVFRRFPNIKVRVSTSGPDFDAAWSPDGKQIAYIDPAGDLMVMTPGHLSRRLVAGGVEALDW